MLVDEREFMNNVSDERREVLDVPVYFDSLFCAACVVVAVRGLKSTGLSDLSQNNRRLDTGCVGLNTENST